MLNVIIALDKISLTLNRDLRHQLNQMVHVLESLPIRPIVYAPILVLFFVGLVDIAQQCKF